MASVTAFRIAELLIATIDDSPESLLHELLPEILAAFAAIKSQQQIDRRGNERKYTIQKEKSLRRLRTSQYVGSMITVITNIGGSVYDKRHLLTYVINSRFKSLDYSAITEFCNEVFPN